MSRTGWIRSLRSCATPASATVVTTHSSSAGSRLHLEVDVDGETLRLVVTFPDFYPYFRFEVQAPDLHLDHHQNPFEKNLCLLRRGTEHWDPGDTVASLLHEQLADVLKTGRSQNIEEVKGLEAPKQNR